MLGYWTALLSREYDEIWQTGLNTIAVNEQGKWFARKKIHEPLKASNLLVREEKKRAKLKQGDQTVSSETTIAPF